MWEVFKTFSSFKEFANTPKNSHWRKKYHCNECEKSFRLIDTLKSHERIHTGKQPFVCNICKKKFTESSSKQKHQIAHNGKSVHKNFLKKWVFENAWKNSMALSGDSECLDFDSTVGAAIAAVASCLQNLNFRTFFACLQNSLRKNPDFLFLTEFSDDLCDLILRILCIL